MKSKVKYAKRFGKLVRKRRQHEGWTQQAAAKDLGISFQHLSGIERGYPNLDTVGISVEVVTKVAKWSGLKPQEFIKKCG